MSVASASGRAGRGAAAALLAAGALVLAGCGQKGPLTLPPAAAGPAAAASAPGVAR